MAEDCAIHQKVYSGERFATNPPKWFWICEHCGELGRTEADEVYPRDFKRFARAWSISIRMKSGGPEPQQ